MNMMSKKGFSVPQCPPRVSGDLILPHRIIDEAHSRKQHSYEDTRKLQIAGRGKSMKSEKDSKYPYESLTVESWAHRATKLPLTNMVFVSLSDVRMIMALHECHVSHIHTASTYRCQSSFE